LRPKTERARLLRITGASLLEAHEVGDSQRSRAARSREKPRAGLTTYAGARVGSPLVLRLLFAAWVLCPFAAILTGYAISRLGDLRCAWPCIQLRW
jgi:hypothetical protein